MMLEFSVSEIKQFIHLVRGQRVMLDSTLAEFYQVENRSLKRAVRRNSSRFPSDFMFELTEEEAQALLCHFGTAKTLTEERRGGNRFSPYAFTESGVAMLSSVVKSERAAQVNVSIVRAFVSLRQQSETNQGAKDKLKQLEDNLNRIEEKYDYQFKLVLNAIHHLRTSRDVTEAPPPTKRIQFEKVSDLDLGKDTLAKVDAICQTVAQYFGLEASDLKRACRAREVVLPRQIAIYLIRKNSGVSFRELGKIFGLMDHTTTLYAYKKVALAAEQDDRIKEVIRTIQNSILTF